MYFGQNSKYMQNFQHLTRWVAPTPSIVLTPPINVSSNKIKKVKIPYIPFTFIHPTDTQTDTQTHQLV